MAMNSKRYVRIIMPVGSDPRFAERKAAITTAIHRLGMDARFPDYTVLQPTFVLSALIDELRGAHSVVADLSLERPSCYYELGVAETIGMAVYLVAEVGTRIHQSSFRDMIFYYKTLDDLTATIEAAVKEHA